MTDPRARLLSAWYVLAIGSVGAFHPYLAVILDRRGASGTELALCLALFPAGLLLCGPLWGLRTDRSARPQRVIGVALTAAAAGALGMLVPGSWVVLVPAMALLAMTRSPAVAVGDVLVVRLLGGGRTGEAAYGAVRSWGSVAFIGIVFAVGWLMDRWLVAPLVVHAALLLGLAALTWRLPAPAPEQRAAAGPSTSVGAVLRSPLLGLYVVSVLHIGANSLYDNLFAHHVTGLGLGARVAGVAIALGVAVEVVVLFRGRWLLERFEPRVLLAIAVLAGIPRWWLTGTTGSPTVLVLTQSLHGLTFGFWWLGGIAHVLRMAPEGLRSTAQAAFVASGFGLGNLIALGIASYALPTWGSARLFTGLTVVSMLAALLLPWALSRRSSGSSARP